MLKFPDVFFSDVPSNSRANPAAYFNPPTFKFPEFETFN